MANERRPQQQSSSSTAKGAKPWTLYLLRDYETRNAQKKTDFIRVGDGFPNTQKLGFTFDVHVTIPPGSRVAIFPPDER